LILSQSEIRLNITDVAAMIREPITVMGDFIALNFGLKGLLVLESIRVGGWFFRCALVSSFTGFVADALARKGNYSLLLFGMELQDLELLLFWQMIHTPI
jgi:hypothetical protein